MFNALSRMGGTGDSAPSPPALPQAGAAYSGAPGWGQQRRTWRRHPVVSTSRALEPGGTMFGNRNVGSRTARRHSFSVLGPEVKVTGDDEAEIGNASGRRSLSQHV